MYINPLCCLRASISARNHIMHDVSSNASDKANIYNCQH